MFVLADYEGNQLSFINILDLANTFGENSCHLVRCLMLSVHRRCHPVVTCKLQKICSCTSMNSHRNAHETRPAAALNSLTSPILMSLCKELETSVFRCQELLSNLCRLRRHLFSPCHMETLHLRHHSCRFLQRHHFSVFQGETPPVTPRVENSTSTFADPSTLPADSAVTTEVPSTLLPDPVCAHTHADPVVAPDHVPTQFDEESAVATQSDDPCQFDDPPVPAPVILSQSNPVYDHRDDLPHHIRTQLQSRIRKPAQNLEPDAKRLRLEAGKREVLMWSHDVSSGPECRKPVTIFTSCENSGCADVLLTRRVANKEVQYDALVQSQQVRVDAAMVREWDKWNEFGVARVPVQEAAERKASCLRCLRTFPALLAGAEDTATSPDASVEIALDGKQEKIRKWESISGDCFNVSLKKALFLDKAPSSGASFAPDAEPGYLRSDGSSAGPRSCKNWRGSGRRKATQQNRWTEDDLLRVRTRAVEATTRARKVEAEAKAQAKANGKDSVNDVTTQTESATTPPVGTSASQTWRLTQDIDTWDRRTSRQRSGSENLSANPKTGTLCTCW